MSEEDEIREAVAAMLAAQEAGEDISELLPTAEGFPTEFEEPERPAEAVGTDVNLLAAVARALNHVRSLSRASRLATVMDWAEAGLVPPSMTDEDLEMAVYDRLAAYRDACDLDETLGTKIGGDSAASTGGSPSRSEDRARAARNPHVVSAFSSSPGRPVGMSGFKRHSTAANAVGCIPDEPCAQIESGKVPATSIASAPSGSNVSAEATAGLPSPMSAEDSAANAASAAPDPAVDFPDCQGIRLLMGAHGYYLYDEKTMTDAFARWAFLAAEDDPVATFVECVRDESRIYPRPLALTNLANPPFRMNAEAVEAAFQQARDQGRAADIERIEASNGDVYFYSTDHLTPARAQSLAEYDAVERTFNV